MKAVKEALSPTRVKLTIEVPFDELKPSVDLAYKKVAGQVKVQGFRPGKVPPRILDQRVGRGAILSEALDDAVSRAYSAAVTEQEVEVLGRPDVDVSSFSDGEPLVFTAEVDVRPEVELPELDGLPVTVEDASVTDAELDEQISGMRDRFAVLQGVERPVETGDFVSIDLAATGTDGLSIPDATTSGLSYEVGSATLIEGLDDQLVGMTDGASGTFSSQLIAGDAKGTDAQVTVTVRSVKSKVLPELDDEFATTASEFDTLAELKADLSTRLGRIKRLQQGMEARDKVLEVLLERVDVPLPAAAVDAEVDGRKHNMGHQLENAGLTLEGYLADQEQTQEDFDAELRTSAEQSVKASLVLDAIARKEELGVNDAELTEQVVRRAQRAGMDPQSYADQLVRAGQIPLLAGEIVRGKALAMILENAVVTDTAGASVDIKALSEEMDGRAPAQDPAGDQEQVEAVDSEGPAAATDDDRVDAAQAADSSVPEPAAAEVAATADSDAGSDPA